MAVLQRYPIAFDGLTARSALRLVAIAALFAGLYVLLGLSLRSLAFVVLLVTAISIALQVLGGWASRQWFVELGQTAMTARLLGATRISYKDIHSIEIDSRGRTVIHFARPITTTMFGILKVPRQCWRLPIRDPEEFRRSLERLKTGSTEQHSMD